MKQDKKQDSKKEENNSNTEESELEEEIEEQEELIEDNEFHGFMQDSLQSFSPVLEKIESSQQESLEENVASAPITNTKEESMEDISKYTEPDYKDIEELRKKNENLLVRTTPIDIERTRVNLHPRIEQDFKIAQEIQELKRSEGNLEEEYVVKAEKLNRENRLPFEQTERKYKGREI